MPAFHMGIIPDGNRRWARERGLTIHEGHLVGGQKMRMAGEWAMSHPEIRILSVYALSEENYRRSQEELDWLYKTYDGMLKDLAASDVVSRNRVRIKIVSTNDRPIPDFLMHTFREVERATAHHDQRVLNILLGYTGESEVVQAVQRLMLRPLSRVRALGGGLAKGDIMRELLVKEPCDFIIRTGREEGPREAKSGFLLLQSAYAEYYHLEKFWPEVTEDDLNACWEYFKVTRRLKGDGVYKQFVF